MVKFVIGVLALAVIGLLVWGVGQKMKVDSKQSLSESTMTTETGRTTYSGTLPCGDCSGIETTLVLYQNEDKQPTTYKMTSIYTGKNVDPLVENGKWTIESGQGAYHSETIYKLSSEAGSEQNFILSNDSLQLLDGSGNRLPGSLPSTLELVK